MQVKVLFEAIEVFPALVQAPPALTAAFAGIRGRDRKRASTDKNAISFLLMDKS
jgi:hypothetical protein